MGNAVGTLGFADELVVLVACPAWGVVSDRIGVRMVSRNSIETITVRSNDGRFASWAT